MGAFFTDYLDRLESLHNDLKGALTEMPNDGLDWVPGVGMNSLCVLAVHVAGAERYWIGDVVAGEPSGRDREAEFLSKDMAAATLADRLDGSLAYTRGVVQRLKLSDLDKIRFSPQHGREYAVGWVLAHVLAHAALHAGHAQVTRQLWEQKNT